MQLPTFKGKTAALEGEHGVDAFAVESSEHPFLSVRI